MKISDQTSISMPMRNLLSIVAAVAVGVWAYFGVIERLNNLETKAQLAEKDLTQAVYGPHELAEPIQTIPYNDLSEIFVTNKIIESINNQ